MPFRLALALALTIVFSAFETKASVASKTAELTAIDQQKEHELQNRLCQQKEISCQYVISVFGDPRLKIHEPLPPPPAADQPPSRPEREREKNPYLTKRFGLLSPESLERCRSFVSAHAATFATAYQLYGVAKEIICGHLRIETDFGIPTKASPYPLGTHPAINQLVTLYIDNSSQKAKVTRPPKKQNFAFAEISALIAAGEKFGWDLFTIPGSPTGAVGLMQFEPSSFTIAVDEHGLDRIDLFDPDDAILSIAHFLVTRGWDSNPEHQRRAIYAYYGGHYDRDPHKYYMKAVLKYADEVSAYLKQKAS